MPVAAMNVRSASRRENLRGAIEFCMSAPNLTGY
jgi:hypothetical protein